MKELNDEKIKEIMGLIEGEMRRAAGKHNPLNSFHEGWAVMMEEMDELWDEVKKQTGKRDLPNMKIECKQIAAMAARFMYDLL